jgi:hypothetical protein
MQAKDLKVGTLVGHKRGNSYGDPTRCIVLDNRRWRRQFRSEDYRPGDGKGSGIPLAFETRETKLVDGEIQVGGAIWKFLLANPKDILGPWDEVVERTAQEKENRTKYLAEKKAREDRWDAAKGADKARAAKLGVHITPTTTAHDSSTDAPRSYTISREDLHLLLDLAGES